MDFTVTFIWLLLVMYYYRKFRFNFLGAVLHVSFYAEPCMKRGPMLFLSIVNGVKKSKKITFRGNK